VGEGSVLSLPAVVGENFRSSEFRYGPNLLPLN
jgi:hypothetical protein